MSDKQVGEFTATIPIIVRKARFGGTHWEAEALGLGLAATAPTADGAVRTLLSSINNHGISGRGRTDDKAIARLDA